MDKKGLKVKIFLNFFGPYIKLSQQAEEYTTNVISLRVDIRAHQHIQNPAKD